jgi:hypothetical protein
MTKEASLAVLAVIFDSLPLDLNTLAAAVDDLNFPDSCPEDLSSDEDEGVIPFRGI